MGCLCSSDHASRAFIEECQKKFWQGAEALITDGYPNSPEIVNVNAVIDGTSLLSAFLQFSDGNQLSILEKILFPPNKPRQQQSCCDIFDQKHQRLLNFGHPLVLYQLFYVATKRGNIPASTINDEENDDADGDGNVSGPSVAPYLQLILEAADILPSPKKRNDPSIWLRHASHWNNDKERFVMDAVMLAIRYRTSDINVFRLIFDNNLIQNQDNLIHIIYLLAARHGTAPILRELLSCGKFPDSLKNVNITPGSTAQPGRPDSTPLSAAVLSGNVEFVKELVANNVGGAVTDGIPENPSHSLRMYHLRATKLSQGCHKINVLHLAAVLPPPIGKGEADDAETRSRPSVFDEILTVLLAMAGSNEIKNATAPFVMNQKKKLARMSLLFAAAKEEKNIDDDDDDSGPSDYEVTPAMLAAMQKHESRLQILLANGGDQLPSSLTASFSTFNDWLEDLKKRHAEEDRIMSERKSARGKFKRSTGTAGGATGAMRMMLVAKR